MDISIKTVLKGDSLTRWSICCFYLYQDRIKGGQSHEMVNLLFLSLSRPYERGTVSRDGTFVVFISIKTVLRGTVSRDGTFVVFISAKTVLKRTVSRDGPFVVFMGKSH